jgi:hypothetical protein
MAITAAALVPHPPLLVPELGRVYSPDVEQLRSACRRAVALLLDRVDALLVVGPAPSWGEAAAGATGSFAPYGAAVTTRLPAPAEGAPAPAGAAHVPAEGASAPAEGASVPGPSSAQLRAAPAENASAPRPSIARPQTGPAPAEDAGGRGGDEAPGGWLDRRDLPAGRLTELPLSLAVAAWLLDLVAGEGAIPRLAAFGVPASMRVERAAATGRALAGAVRPGMAAGLLVMGDLSARRTTKAPAAFHPAAEEFDRRIADAIGKAELGQLLDADASLARELRVGGMAALWVLAGAFEDAGDLRTEVLYDAAPFGVGYLVGVVESR